MEKYLVLKTNGMIEEIDGNNYESTYELLSKNVEGSIECIRWIEPFAKRGIDLWINDEGKLLDLDLSLGIKKDGSIIEILNGNIVFGRYNYEGETLPLNEEDIIFIKKTLQEEHAIIGFANPFTGTSLVNLIPVVSF